MTHRAVVLLVTLVVLAAGLPAVGRPARSAGSPVYVALGDSIAAGIGSSLPRERGYTALVHDLIARATGREAELRNLAVPGETAGSFRDGGQLGRFRDLIDRLGQSGVEVAAVTVSLGGNEMLRVSGGGATERQLALDDFQAAYPAALSEVRAAVGPDVPLVVTNYYDLSAGDPSVVESDAWWVSRFNEVISSVAAASGASVADVARAFDGRIDTFTLAPYDVHPTNAGHRAIALAVWRALAIDTAPPAIDAPATLDATRDTPTLRFSTRDDTGIDGVRAEAAGATVVGPFPAGTDEWVALVDVTRSEGTVTVTIQATDAAGNTATREVRVNPPDQTR